MKKKLISVIVPVYNVEDYINKCIHSLVNQTYRSLEIILVDDGSTDSSGKICDMWSKKDKRIIVKHKKNGGVSSARNEGIKIATGDYIAFVDSDDYVDKDMYDFLVLNLEKNAADVSICSSYDVINGKAVHNKLENINIVMNNVQALLNIYKIGYYGNGLCNKLFKRKTIENNLFPVGIKNGEEILVLFKALKNSKKIVYQSIPKYYYVDRSDSATHKFVNSDVCKNIQKLMNENKKFLDKNNELKSIIKSNYYLSVFQLYNHCILYGGSRENLDYSINELNNSQKKIIFRELSKLKCFQLKLYYFSPKLYNLILKIYSGVKKIYE